LEARGLPAVKQAAVVFGQLSAEGGGTRNGSACGNVSRRAPVSRGSWAGIGRDVGTAGVVVGTIAGGGATNESRAGTFAVGRIRISPIGDAGSPMAVSKARGAVLRGTTAVRWSTGAGRGVSRVGAK
jgi:hypothetical protein